MQQIEKSKLWISALAARDGDEFSSQRDRLRTSLLQMRSEIGRFVSEISRDCPNLTVHDISHLDALWEMADLVAGDGYPITPVEAFVFGASVLLHDAAQTLIAFPGGIESIKLTTEWMDLRASITRKKIESELEDNLSSEEYDALLFEVLRSLHAKQAENLATQSWDIGKSGEKIYLLNDVELRKSFGRSIGRIANSHHWSLDRVGSDLRDDLGPSPDLPSSWTLSERKVACLLRCSDIAHIDRRRAPSIMLAAKQINESSVVHWIFQNKLNRPSISESNIIYTSGEDFLMSEAPSWWLCYDVIREVDREIRTSNSLLEEIGQRAFRAQRVMGADTPRALAKYITTQGWRPVDAELRVSDPVHLARTLGGANLYGGDEVAPLRELLQNAIDAVRARRAYENRPASWGSVNVSVVSASSGGVWLHVDDDGIGMSETTLTGALLDFGKSFWSSRSLRNEFPGLESKNVNFIGRFGIGFFSIFLLGSKVRVVSRRFDASKSATKVLEFNGIESRPLLRDSGIAELPLDVSTRVSVLLDADNVYSKYVLGNVSSTPPISRIGRRIVGEGLEDVGSLENIISFVDVNIVYKNSLNGTEFFHSSNVLSSDGNDFLRKVIVGGGDDVDTVIAIHANRLELITDGDVVFGRAALNLTPELSTNRRYGARVHHSWNRLSVGGMTTQSYSPGHSSFFVGVLRGKTAVAARNAVDLDVPQDLLARWAAEQCRKIPIDEIGPSQLVAICHNVVSINGDPGEIPFCIHGGKFISYGEFLKEISKLDEVIIPVFGDEAYDSQYVDVNVHGISGVSDISLGRSLNEAVFVISNNSASISSRDPTAEEWSDIISGESEFEIAIDDLIDNEVMSIPRIVRIIESVWGVSCGVRLVAGEMYSKGLYKRQRGEVLMKLYKS